ncbi:MAG: ComEC/Rec2 family competence protein [Clostridiales bacterium]|nr:ComEC/Rec2 family competence protein [Clostridiales bacterium]
MVLIVVLVVAAVLAAAVIPAVFEKAGVPLFLLVFLLLGFWRADGERSRLEGELALGLSGASIEAEGRLVSLTLRSYGWEMELEDCEVSGAAKETARLLVYASMDPRPRIGQRLWVSGKCLAYEPARNPGAFDYRNYYRSRGISYRVNAKTAIVTGDNYSHIGDAAYELARWASGILEMIAREDAGIFQAALLGERSGLSEEVRSLYQRNGIAHLLAISGRHLSMVSAAAYGSLRFLGFGYGAAGIFGGLLLSFYGYMSGASPSVLRALIMALLGFLAAWRGRTYDPLSALGFAAILLAWEHPYRLTQAGVQLSFAAVAGIAGVAPCLCRLFVQDGNTGLRAVCAKTLCTSLALQLTTLPVVLWHFFYVPPYGILLNLVVVPLMGIVVASGAAGIALGAWKTAAGCFAVGSGRAVLALYNQLCRFCERLPGGTLVLGRPESGRIVLYYALLAVLLGLSLWKQKREKCKTSNEDPTGSREPAAYRRPAGSRVPICGICCAVLIVLMIVTQLPSAPDSLRVTFLDVGQGDGICLRVADATILVDGGSTDEKDLGEDCLEPFFMSQGITTIDAAIVSHGDNDHISGLRWLLTESRDVSVRRLILPAGGRDDEACLELAELAAASGAQVSWMSAGNSLECGELSLKCLYPASGYPAENHPAVQTATSAEEDRNAQSLVIRSDYGNLHLLLTGDMGSDNEEELLSLLSDGGRKQLSDIQVLKVAHHGSRYSSTAEWLDAVSPGWAVISSGAGNSYGHPHAETLERLAARGISILQTAERGAVSLFTDGTHIRWETMLEGS